MILTQWEKSLSSLFKSNLEVNAHHVLGLSLWIKNIKNEEYLYE